MKKSELRTLIREEIRRVIKESNMKSEEEFFHDLQTKPNGDKAIQAMQDIDPSEYDSNDLQNEYQRILDSHKTGVKISKLRMDSQGNVKMMYK